jgi:hypothetical protein
MGMYTPSHLLVISSFYTIHVTLHSTKYVKTMPEGSTYGRSGTTSIKGKGKHERQNK